MSSISPMVLSKVSTSVFSISISRCLLAFSAFHFSILYWILSRLDLGIEVIHLSGRPLLLYSIALLLLGGQFMSIGFLAELFIAYHSPHTKTYSICECAGKDDPKKEKMEEKDEG